MHTLQPTDPVGYSNLRAIDEQLGRKLAAEMHRNCVYYETWALSGLNVDRVFQDSESSRNL